MEAPPLKHLVIDAGAIIKGVRVEKAAQFFWTVPEIIHEVRDKKARQMLDSLPYKLRVVEPSKEAMNFVARFARKTGDMRNLSVPDLKVLALTYMMEHRENGMKFMRTEPKKKAITKKQIAEYQSRKTHNHDKDDDDEDKIRPEPVAALVDEAEDKTVESKIADEDSAPMIILDEDIDEGSDSSSSDEDGPNDDEEDMEIIKMAQEEEAAKLEKEKKEKEEEEEEEAKKQKEQEQEDGPDEDGFVTVRKKRKRPQKPVHKPLADDEGWVTPDNISSIPKQAWGGLGKEDDESSDPTGCTGCITVDFAMQNVLMNLNIPLLSVSGRQIRKLKQWVLRCRACFSITSDMERMFCPECGSNVMSRLSCSVDTTGNIRFHMKKNFRVNTRGTKYSIPKDKGGRATGMLLREDQLLQGKWRQKVQKRTKYDSIFSDASSKFGKAVFKDEVTFGAGRKNPNSQKGRERRGKKKRR